MTEKLVKPGWKVWRFEQMATNANIRTAEVEAPE